MNLGENIYRNRTARNLSQGDLADALEVSRQSVSKWENNSAVPELDKLRKMAQLFGISLDALVTGAETQASAPMPAAAPASKKSESTHRCRHCILFSGTDFLIGRAVLVSCHSDPLCRTGCDLSDCQEATSAIMLLGTAAHGRDLFLLYYRNNPHLLSVRAAAS